MIFGLSQIVYAQYKDDMLPEFLSNTELVFKEQNSLLEIKSQFMQKYQACDMEFYEHLNHISVEIVKYKTLYLAEQRLALILKNNLENSQFVKNRTLFLGDNCLIEYKSKHRDEVYFTSDIDRGIVIFSNDIPKLTIFFNTIKCITPTEISEFYAIFDIKSIIPTMKAKLIIIYQTKKQKLTLDTYGFNCLTFYTNSLDEDLLQISSNDSVAYCSQIISSKINKKTVRIAFIHTTEGMIFEFIEQKGNYNG